MNRKIIFISVGVGILIICVAVAVIVGMSGKEEPDDVPGLPISPADFLAADVLDGSHPAYSDGKDDKIWIAGLFEGDIANFDPSVGKNALRGEKIKWPKNTIPYEISSTFTVIERSIIAKAMKEYQEKTCIRFVPRTKEPDYISIIKSGGCWSDAGRTGGKQDLSAGPNCGTGSVIHEFMHALGFYHEQSRTDRDKYVSIKWDNIIPGMEDQFEKYGQDKITHLGAKYDVCSVMHYPDWAFRKTENVTTIVQKQAGKCTIGQRVGFSDTDMRKINTLYDCKGYPNVGGGGGNGTTVKTTPRPTEQTTIKPNTTTAKPSGCEDNYKWCEYWAKNDECVKSPNVMNVNCRKSCNQCNSKCVDNESHCQEWADKGFCQDMEWFMNEYCPKACNKC